MGWCKELFFFYVCILQFKLYQSRTLVKRDVIRGIVPRPAFNPSGEYAFTPRDNRPRRQTPITRTIPCQSCNNQCPQTVTVSVPLIGPTHIIKSIVLDFTKTPCPAPIDDGNVIVEPPLVIDDLLYDYGTSDVSGTDVDPETSDMQDDLIEGDYSDILPESEGEASCGEGCVEYELPEGEENTTNPGDEVPPTNDSASAAATSAAAANSYQPADEGGINNPTPTDSVTPENTTTDNPPEEN